MHRKDSGTYICQAENSIGVSKEEAAEVNVLCEYLTSFKAICRIKYIKHNLQRKYIKISRIKGAFLK